VDHAHGGRVAVQTVAAARLLQEIAGGVAGPWAVVVVGAEDVRPRELHQRTQRVQDLRDALGVREVVARVDHEVGAQARQGAQPALLLALTADHVDVGDLEHAQGTHSGRENGDRHPSEAEGAGFEARRVHQTGGASRRDRQRYSVSRAHGPIVSDPASTLSPAVV
jgi:hypothetical protein